MTVSTRIDDPLDARSAEGPDRVNYAMGVLLDDGDFRDEQTYHRGRLARALKYLFGPGTVAGLRVGRRALAESPDEEIVVAPGLCIDPMGRLIEIPRTACLRVGRWWDGQTTDTLRSGFHAVAPDGFALPGVLIDLFVRFRPCERGKTPAFASGPFDATDALVGNRLRDGYELELIVRSEGSPGKPPDTLALAAQRDADLSALRESILDGWHEDVDDWDEGSPKPLNEHAQGKDTRSLLLARLLIPATLPAPTVEEPSPRPIRSGAVVANNNVRRFVYGTGVLAWSAP